MAYDVREALADCISTATFVVSIMDGWSVCPGDSMHSVSFALSTDFKRELFFAGEDVFIDHSAAGLARHLNSLHSKVMGNREVHYIPLWVTCALA